MLLCFRQNNLIGYKKHKYLEFKIRERNHFVSSSCAPKMMPLYRTILHFYNFFVYRACTTDELKVWILYLRSHFGKMQLCTVQVPLYDEKSVQLVRVASFRNDFLQNPYFGANFKNLNRTRSDSFVLTCL